MSKRQKKKKPTAFLGTYSLAGGQSAVGKLRLKGSRTRLTLHSTEFLRRIEMGSCLTGRSYSGECLTLIDCHSSGTGSTSIRNGPTQYHADVFPHYVAIGHSHIDPTRADVSAIYFTTTDLATLFYDYDAFGQVLHAEKIIDVVLEENRQLRPVEPGEDPLVFYFTGKYSIAQVETVAGKISVYHQPSYSVGGGPTGFYVKNRIAVSIEPDEPVVLNDALERMYDVASFLSIAAGRAQGIDNIHVTTAERIDDSPVRAQIHPSFKWRPGHAGEYSMPHPADVPLDPINRPGEFNAVLVNWLGRHAGWRVARSRYLACLRLGNHYGPDRLVAAANMFDILPAEAVPGASALPDELAATRDLCAEEFRKHAPGIDRDSALSALGRLGKPSLPKKVAHRARIVESRLGQRFTDLQLVAEIAVKCRNYFVHGSSDGIDYDRIENLVPFLTDTLEFVFAASDFIEAGWNPQQWRPGGWGHSFSRYHSEFNAALAAVRRAIAT